MKLKALIAFISVLLFCSSAFAQEWRHYMGITNRGTATSNAIYCKNMAYDYIGVESPSASNVAQYTGTSTFNGMYYYTATPGVQVMTKLGRPTAIDITLDWASPTATMIDDRSWYNNHCAWKTNVYSATGANWWRNLHQGFWQNGGNTFMPIWDYQDQQALTVFVNAYVDLMDDYEAGTNTFTYGGYIVDTPMINGTFNNWDGDSSDNVIMGNNTGHVSYPDTPLSSTSYTTHGTITHEYADYKTGIAKAHIQLDAAIKAARPTAKAIFEPNQMYKSTFSVEYLYELGAWSGDRDSAMPDMLVQESGNDMGTYDFANGYDAYTEDTLYTPNWNIRMGTSPAAFISKSVIGNNARNLGTWNGHKAVAGRAALNGMWTNYFIKWGGDGGFSGEDYSFIEDVPHYIKLIKCIPNWDNMNSAVSRSWDGTTYVSSKSRISANLMYSRHPTTQKLWAVFLNGNETISITTGTPTAVVRATTLNADGTDASSHFNITGTQGNVTIATNGSTILGTTTAAVGMAYIFTIGDYASPQQTITYGGNKAKSTTLSGNQSVITTYR